MALALWIFGLLASACLVSANIFEYQVDAQPLRPCELQRARAFGERADHVPQCAEDGSFQTVQCRSDGRSCWCVGADGREVAGSRQPGRPVACLSFCQLHRQQVLLSGYLNGTAASSLPQCQGSGEYAPVQCDVRREQCWCVDTEGMEVYGTRQRGRPTRCPRSCEIRNRRLLHGVGDKSPPQCSSDGGFLPVQCKFVNTTDMMVFNLVHGYNRFPDAFLTFSAFRRRFPEVSGYCYCADSQGRELAETGLELLLDDIYDTVFAGLALAPTFTDTTLYRILQRRFLALQLVLSGRFRCPTKCEVERFTATDFGHAYVPSCHRNGDFEAAQCQRGGPCWCADAQGKEVPGTRRQDAALPCAGAGSCSSERRRALSRLRFWPSGDLSLQGSFVTPRRGAGGALPCLPAIKQLFVDSGILRSLIEGQNPPFPAAGSLLPEAVRGLFPSRELARLALQFTANPKRLQQNLFGGRFLANVGQFNLSGALGTRGSFNFSQFFQRLGLPGFQGGGGLVNQAKLLSAGLDSNPAVETPGPAKEGRAMNKTIVGSFGFEVNVQENQNALKSLASLLDLPEFLLFLQHAVSVPEDIARDLGDVMGMVLNSQGCELTPGGLFVPSCTAEGSYEDVQCLAGECWCVDSQGTELPSSRVRGGRPRCPTECEKQRARRLSLVGSQPAGSSLSVPSCTRQGHFLPVQCFDSECYCVDEEGQAIPGTQSAPGRPQQCPTPCQLRAERAFLGAARTLVSSSSLPPALSSIYIPQCSARGQWRPVQCDGPPEQAFEWYERWKARDSSGREPTVAELLTKVLSYRDAASGSFRRFLQSLYEAGQQGVFPGLARYSSLGEVPPAVLDGNRTRPGGNVLLEPYLFWQILRGQLRRYPGPYSDFSAPLAHLDLRTCWCVDEAGQEREGTRTEPGEAPACPGSCADAQLRALQFIADSEEVVLASNSSWFPLGESLLAATGIRLSNEELGLPPGSPPREAFSQQFLRGSEDALRLAAQSTFDFYQSRRSSPAASSGASRLRSSPYVPQCDAFGNWEPVQCHAGTGNCWCVDGKGQYVPASLTARSSQAPQCPSACERARASGLLSSWKQAGSQGDPSPDDLFIPTCLETGEFARLQATEAGIWCVDQASGEGTLPRTNSSAQCPGLCEAPQGGILSGTAGPGYTPACGAEAGGRSPVQCSPAQESCWCVLGSGEEVPGTRVVGSQPACESPQCPLPFNTSDVAGGVVLCEPASGPGAAAVQRCQLLCRRGYLSAFPLRPLECSLERRRWLSQPPQPRACQRPQLWQTLQARAQFQLRLPPGKMCSADYAGLLLAFQAFISDELTARGFCQVQVKTVGTPVTVPACDDSAVRVECLTQERLGVNVTWKLRLEDVPPASLPDLRDVEEALGTGLAGRFADLIRSGEFQLHLDAKTFPADTSFHFLHGDSVGTSPGTRYGCLEGFHPVSASSDTSQDPLGCVKCPEGSYSQDEQCVPCPAGFYQEQAGSLTCAPCPVGRTTISAGAFSRTHCVTDCQRNEAGLQCDQDGRYRASQRDGDSGKAFCVDDAGQRLLWSETEAPLTDSQCLMMQKFEKVPESKVVFDAEVATGLRSQVPGSEFPLAQCLAGCAMDPACSFLTVSTVGSDVSCDFYAWTSDSITCTASGQGQGAAGNAKATGFGSLRCQVKVPPRDQASVAVYLKKGQEFSTRSRKSFERTGFQNALSGMYSPAVFAGPGSSLTEAHLFCLRACDRDACCDGFVLTQVQGGPIVCGLLSSPDVLLCHVQDWRDPSTATVNATCPGATPGQGSRPGTLLLGGQEFQGPDPREGTQGPLTSFQQVYLWKDSDMGSRSESTGCRRDMGPMSAPPPVADMTSQLFSPVDLTQVVVSGNRSLPSRQHWLFKHLFSPQQANLWCLSRCAQEPSFCQLAEIRDSAPSYFTCTLYPEARVCEDVLEPRPTGCRLILPRRPSALFRRKVVLRETVTNFYTRLPFQTLTGISIRSNVPMSDKSISNGFFECERLCDVDPCCSGFGFLNVSQLTGGKVTCLTLNSLGLQTCSEESGGTWRILDCGSPDTEVRTYPFGWYQKPVAQNGAPGFCPSVALPSPPEKVALDAWQTLGLSAAVVDPSIRSFEVAHISTAAAGDFSAARDLCLLECSRHQACQVTTLQTRPGALRCVFYPDTQLCTHSLQAQHCQLLLREEPTHIYRKLNTPPLGFGTSAPSVTIAPHGQLLGRSQAIQVGTSWKQVDQFLGVPYAAPPLAEGRFRAPEPSNWTGSWAATKPRARCWQPGARTPTPSGVSEDCLYLNVFVPQNVAPNASVLLFFHNMEAGADDGSLALDGSFLAATGHLLVVTAGYRVGVFGFLSAGAGAVSGNWGLLDQVAALTWVQTHIAAFGGDPRRVTMAADRGGADVASTHLLAAGAGGSRLFRRAMLMGGSPLSPAAVISPERAQQQAAALAQEVGCPASPIQEMTSCLRQKPADALNDAQTKLLAVSGPFHYWGPVLDGQFLREAPARALQRAPRATVDLLLGSSQDDGLIRRAKAVKQFEESQGRTSSKTAFYRALQNSLGGEDADPGVLAAATWYYSLEHSADDYASFSRALENATRDYFIICPVIDMARHWARRARGNVFLYHAPQSYGHGSLELLTDAQYAFGLPFHPAYGGQFTLEEKRTALKVMQYFSNFIRSGNPNYPHEFSRKGPEFAAPWPDFVPGANGENYKEFSAQLPNRRGLKKADCSFWSKYIRSLKAPADEAKDGLSAGSEEEEQPAGSGLREDLPDPGSKSYSK
ncbi:thyroglobulin [Myotis daubentonii]|uniref:thyroglobulin n=1 Tax=Myotis daubentonii TaxID=98922 RepID=UPI00287333F4|nr:thyroglobulin [Myotis daubentonii]